MAPSERRLASTGAAALVVAALVVAALVACALAVGPADVTLADVGAALTGDLRADGAFVVHTLRLPRALVALLGGLALGTAGALLQDALRNPLVDPGLIGVSHGAAFAAALAAFYPELTPPLPTPLWCALVGGAVGVAVLALFGRLRDPTRLVVGGAVASGALAVLSAVVIFAAPWDRVSFGAGALLRYLAGSLGHVTWSDLAGLVPWVALALPIAWLCGRVANLLQLGDDLAAGVGLAPHTARMVLIGLALWLTGPVVALIGPMALVALLAPHAARGLLGRPDARWALPMAGLCGAAILLAADVAARLLFAPAELPAGLLTLAVAGPLALVALRRLAPRGAT